MDESSDVNVSVYKWVLQSEVRRLRRMLQWLPPGARAKVQAGLTRAMIGEPFRFETAAGPIAFTLMGRSSADRALALLTKQPETIKWIDSFRPQSVFWDIGANVGAYTLYAGRRGDIAVVAFEPAAVNYFLLTANCELNGLEERVDCLLAGLGDEKRMGRLQVSQFDPGRSFSFKGKRKEVITGRQCALILTIDQLLEEYGVACPNYIKIDVPHMTEAIVRGGARTLQRPEVRELHIEASDDSPRDSGMIELLKQFGFTISARHTRQETTDLTFSKSL